MMELPLIELGKAGGGGNFDGKNQKLSVRPVVFYYGTYSKLCLIRSPRCFSTGIGVLLLINLKATLSLRYGNFKSRKEKFRMKIRKGQ